jgi:hypothetical protein
MSFTSGSSVMARIDAYTAATTLPPAVATLPPAVGVRDSTGGGWDSTNTNYPQPVFPAFFGLMISP